MTTDQQLAKNWMDAWNEHAEGGDEEALILADNAIAARLDLPLDETEQGLTNDAAAQIKSFVDRNLTRVVLVDPPFAYGRQMVVEHADGTRERVPYDSERDPA